MGQEELDFFVAEAAQLRAEDIVDADMFRIPAGHISAECCAQIEEKSAHARYATVRDGSLLKCSDSMKRSSRFQLMEDVSTVSGGSGTRLSSSIGHLWCKAGLPSQ